MNRSLISASGTFPGPGQRSICDLAEAGPGPQPITTRHHRLAQPRGPGPAAPAKGQLGLVTLRRGRRREPELPELGTRPSPVRSCTLGHATTTATPSRRRRARVKASSVARAWAWGCRHGPGHQGAMLSPRGNLDFGAAGRELDDDRFVAWPLQAVGMRGMLPQRGSTGISSLRTRSGALVQTKTSRTQRPEPRFHFGLRPSTSPSDTRIAPANSPGCRLSHRLVSTAWSSPGSPLGRLRPAVQALMMPGTRRRAAR